MTRVCNEAFFGRNERLACLWLSGSDWWLRVLTAVSRLVVNDVCRVRMSELEYHKLRLDFLSHMRSCPWCRLTQQDRRNGLEW